METLIENSKNNDIQSFTKLIQTIENDLYRIASIRLKNIDDITDATQNTIINIYKNIHKIRNYQYFKTWAIRILINECNKIYKQKSKNSNYQNEIDVLPSSSYCINDIDNKIDFELALKNLNYEENLVITLKYGSQLSCSEISKILKINVNTVKSRLKRGKEKIKEYYEGRRFSDEIQSK